MKSILDNETAELTCPQCGHKFKERLGKLKLNPTLTCSKCKVSIPIDANQVRQLMQKIDKSVADIQRAAGRIFK